ncbi:hypothetical protein BLOT_001704 [Blomia tropicalis]|nr:hypothetical protein BLOT_001704 [Blomia tropicalis]
MSPLDPTPEFGIDLKTDSWRQSFDSLFGQMNLNLITPSNQLMSTSLIINDGRQPQTKPLTILRLETY